MCLRDIDAYSEIQGEACEYALNQVLLGQFRTSKPAILLLSKTRVLLVQLAFDQDSLVQFGLPAQSSKMQETVVARPQHALQEYVTRCFGAAAMPQAP